MSFARQGLGRFGEQLAERHLISLGYRVLDRNWRCATGELDIVAADGPVAVAVEVKARSGEAFGRPLEAITPAKLARVRRLAVLWVEQSGRRFAEVRVDAIGVVLPARGRPRIEHVIGIGA